MNVRRLDRRSAGFRARLAALAGLEAPHVEAGVRAIVEEVRARGDDAVVELANRFDERNVAGFAEREVPAARTARELPVAEPAALADRIRNAGTVLLGRHSPEVPGDYRAGPNHVLPTGRSARFASPLGVYDFRKRMNVIRCPEAAARRLGRRPWSSRRRKGRPRMHGRRRFGCGKGRRARGAGDKIAPGGGRRLPAPNLGFCEEKVRTMSMGGVSGARRRFLTATASVVGGVGLGFTAVPFISSWQPSERARAIGAPVQINVSKLEPGQLVTVLWRGKPVWVVRRTPETLDALSALDPILRDPDSEVAGQQPDYARNRHRSLKPEYLVLVGICTHLGCSPQYVVATRADRYNLGADWRGGFFCPCHGSMFDLAGRVYPGVPAPTNLEVPPHRYLDGDWIEIGVDHGAKDALS